MKYAPPKPWEKALLTDIPTAVEIAAVTARLKAQRKAYDAARRQNRIAAGECVRCGKKLPTGQVKISCAYCSRQNNR